MSVLDILNEYEKTFFFPGYQKYHRDKLEQLLRSSPIVLAHNDCNATNLLSSLDDATIVKLIDYEFAGWQPSVMDLASYFNETMLDNVHKSGVKSYLCNCITDTEIDIVLVEYLLHYFKKYALKTHDKTIYATK